MRAGTRSLRLECLEERRLLTAEPLEVMPTSPFIVSPFTDPLVIPEALAPGWRNPDGTLAPTDDPMAWSVRETQYAGATPTGDPDYPYISPPGPGVNQQDSIGFLPAIPGLYEQHEGQHQVWPNQNGQNWDRLVGPEGGPYPDPILYHIRLQVAEHEFTSSRVQPIRVDPITGVATPVPLEDLPPGVVLDGNGTAELPASTIYGFNGTFPGPMINAEYGKPVLVRFENDLDLNPLGLDRQDFGDPAWKSLTHLHNAHTAPESDGNPFYMQQNGGGYLPGQWYDNLYLNYPAGGDPNEKQSFFWYHDHVMDHTGEDVYKGMVGLFPIYDPVLDPGDENAPGGLGLPGIKTVHDNGTPLDTTDDYFDVKYDIPMAFYDVALDDGVTAHNDMHTLPQDVGTHPEWWGKSFYQHFADTGLVGDIFTVNGTAFPVLHVSQREYRFRFLDASVSRIYELALMTSDAGPVAMPGTKGQWQIPDGKKWKPLTQIASMGGLLPESISRDSVQIWPATRNEHVVDFSNAQPGDVIYLTNILEMSSGRKPNFNNPNLNIDEVPYKVPLVKIIVDGPPPVGEEGPTSLPSHLRPMPDLPSQGELDALPRPDFTLARSGALGFENQWRINDRPFNPLVPLHTVTRGQPEAWTIINGDPSGGWVHPMHMHMEEHTVLSRVNSTNPHPDDTGKSDVTNLDPNESVTFYRNFRTFTGRYVAHCHNLLHEDHNMMFGWTIEEPPSANAPQVTGFAEVTDQDTPLSFTTTDFTDRFTDPNAGDSLQTVHIVTTPMHGVLQVNGVGIVPGHLIATANLATLVYVPDAGYAGPDSFTWNGSDGTQYAGAPALVNLVVDLMGSDIVTQWNLSLNLPHDHGGFLASRLRTMMHAAIYDAVMAFVGTHAPYYFTTPPLPGASMEAAATSAAYQVLYTEITDTTQRALIQARLDDHLATIPAGSARTAGVLFGQSVGDAIMMLRATDGAMMALLMEQLDGTQPGEWRRTASGAPLAPGWGMVTPWVMTSGNQFDQGPPPALTSAQYAADYAETHDLGAMTGSSRTTDQTNAVMFWEHHPQPKWYAVARDISGVENLTLAENAQLFHLLSMTMADATIAAFDMKYNYDFWRPETAIHLGDTDGNAATIADLAWQSLIPAPAFPEYLSGHSMNSAAAAKLLEFFFAKGDYTFQLTALHGMHEVDGMSHTVSRTYDSFWQAAEEVGASRVWGGIHFQFSNQRALQAGSELAQYVYATLSGDTTSPTVTIEQAAGQADPAEGSPINFTVVFSEPMFNFATGDVSLSGTAGATTAEVTGSGTTYNVAVSGMTANGSVIVSINAGMAEDAAGNLNTASTSTDNSVSFTGINQAPTDIQWNGVTPALGALPAAGATIANLSTVDPDSVSWTYSLQPGSSPNFAVSAAGAVTRTGSAMARNRTYTVIVQSDDGEGGLRTETFTIRTGTNAANTISAATANDAIIYGVAGKDSLKGGAGNDTLYGGAGNDTLNSGPGNDVLDGGADSDTAGYGGAVGGVTVSLAIAGPQDTIGAGIDTLVDIENLNGSPFADILTGNSARNVLNGGAGGDVLAGGGGADVINVGVANDNVQDIVLFSEAGDFGVPGAQVFDTVNNFDATGTAAQIDRIVFVGALQTLFDNGTVDGNIAWFTGNGSNGGNTPVDLAVFEALFLNGANGEGVSSANLTNAAAVAAEFNAEFNLTAANGEATLLVINDTNIFGNSAAVWQWVQAGGGEMSAGELSLIAVIHANATVTRSSFGFGLGAPLLAASVLAPSKTARGALSPDALRSALQAAAANFASQGLSLSASKLQEIQFVVQDLPGSRLGMASGNTIYLDAHAAGHGWFVDRTPSRDEEFGSAGRGGELFATDPRAVDRIDLLTVVAHELGHLAGLADSDAIAGDLMNSTLSTGVRRTAWSAGVDRVLGLSTT
jgi:FtsP/CotA-like multicopper oxidase with cupredoxin domain/Ca2+-binding RTX toxin-like protein